MQLGIFAKTFNRSDADATLAAVSASGIRATQFNMSVVGLATIPEGPVDPAVLLEVREAADRHGVHLAALSGTFNGAHPDESVRNHYIGRFPHLAAAARALGIPVITLGSGSRNTHDMWAWHDDNTTQEAWRDARSTLVALAEIAAAHDVTLAVEPEWSNVVHTAEQAVRMIDEVGSDRLGVVYDAANLLDPDRFDTAQAENRIAADIATLRPHILLAHAKELVTGRAAAPAGRGLLPWGVIVNHLAAGGFDGTLVTHGLDEADVGIAVDTLRLAIRGASA